VPATGRRGVAVPRRQGSLQHGSLLGDASLLHLSPEDLPHGAAQPDMARGADATPRGSESSADVRSQGGPHSAGYIPPHTALQELHHRHGEQGTATVEIQASIFRRIVSDLMLHF